MTVDHTAARELFLAALERPPDERDAFLRHRSDDAALVAEVRSLLAFHEDEADGGSALAPLQVGERYADRYRILRRIGRGGMGDVYHAHDEVLNDAVALKRLAVPDPVFREALLNEVRLARRVTHPRICRVHDLGEWRGERFITMEYVEGEDLGKLMRRVGRLPWERVAEMARELCVGLAAAHAKGVLHRDLKPANILVDAEGHVHITDFGIAARTGAYGAGVMTGSPSYMAPEQLVPGGSSSERSDVYALGLVLHEMLTGKPVFPGADLADVLVSRRSVVPRPPSEVVDVAPELDRAVQRSLSADPAERPASALELAALLPGGDALLAAAEANTTPSPDLVARAESGSRRAPARPVPKLLALALLLVVTFVLADALGFAPIGTDATHPAVSVDRAVRLLNRLGYQAGDASTAFHGYVRDPSAPGPGPSLLFWYREDRDPYRTAFQRAVLDPTAALTLYVTTTGLEPDRLVTVFDEAGDLVYLQGPPGATTNEEPSGPTDWSRLLAAVGLDRAPLAPVDPELPPTFATDRAAWVSHDPGGAATGPRIDAAAVNGRLVYFSRARGADDAIGRPDARPTGAGAMIVNLVLLPSFFIVAIVFLVRNVRARRYDGAGTLKIAGIVAALAFAEWLLLTGHIYHPLADYSETLTSSLGGVVVASLAAPLFYAALEPAVRHAWPHSLIAWTRALHGPFRSPVVGRAILVGTVAGSLCALLFVADLAVPRMAGTVEPLESIDYAPRLLAALGFRETIAVLLGSAYDAVGRGVILLFLFAMLRSWLRWPALSAVAFVLLVAVLEGGVGPHHGLSIVTMGVPIGIVTAWVLARAGLLALVVSGFVYLAIRFTPMTLDGDAWWAFSGFTTASVVVLLGLVGARMSTASA